MEKVLLSTVTPVYHGGRYLPELISALDVVRHDLQARQLPVELLEAIFVDDASVDDSATVLRELQRTYPWVRVVQLSRNFGQHGATVAGILHSSGHWVATLDEDLQHHPRHLLPMLLHAVAAGNDVVYGGSYGPIHRTAFRNLSSRFYKASLGWVAGNPFIPHFSSFRMMRGSVVRAACSVSTHDTYFDVVLTWFTGRFDALQLPLLDVRTVSGEQSSYGLSRLLRHARRMLVSSEIRPLRFASAIGALSVVISLFLAAGTLILKILHPEVIQLRGWASLIITIAFFGGLTAFLLGVILEYMSTLILHTLGKPTFFVVDRSIDAVLLPAAGVSPQ
jgi:glycosyltransferase involved in cell wall biosynthesis